MRISSCEIRNATDQKNTQYRNWNRVQLERKDKTCMLLWMSPLKQENVSKKREFFFDVLRKTGRQPSRQNSGNCTARDYTLDGNKTIFVEFLAFSFQIPTLKSNE